MFSEGAVSNEQASGVKEAALTYYRHSFDSRSAQAKNIKNTMALKTLTPTLAIGGWDDGCMSAKLYDSAARPDDFPGGLSVERIRGAGHFLHQEAPEKANKLLLAWLKKYDL